MTYTVQLSPDMENVVGKPVYLYDKQVGIIVNYDKTNGMTVMDIEEENKSVFEELFAHQTQGISSRQRMTKKIVVIGEKCEDIFTYGKVTRINPEAPSPVFVISHIENLKGMAHNVFANLSDIINFTGLDVSLEFFCQTNPIVKTRFVEEQHNYILLRVDKEDKVDHVEITDYMISEIEDADIVIVSDYCKGYLNEQDLMKISGHAKCSFLDTKKALGNWAQLFTWIKINMPEFKNDSHDFAFMQDAKNIIITDGKNGAWLNEKHFKTEHADIIDITGAGDTFLSALVYGWYISNDINKSIRFANAIATESVKRKGVVNNIATAISSEFNNLIEKHL